MNEGVSTNVASAYVKIRTTERQIAIARDIHHVLVPAIDRALIDGLAAAGFRVFRACQYMVRGGGTAPPPNYVLMNGDML